MEGPNGSLLGKRLKRVELQEDKNYLSEEGWQNSKNSKNSRITENQEMDAEGRVIPGPIWNATLADVTSPSKNTLSTLQPQQGGRESSCSVQFLHSVVFNSLRPHRLRHTRPPCPSLVTRVYSNSWPLSQWCHSTISSSVIPFSSHVQSFPRSQSFSNESVLHIGWPKYWSFKISIILSNEYSKMISFRMDWLDLLAVQRTCNSLLQHHSSKATILQPSTFFTV